MTVDIGHFDDDKVTVEMNRDSYDHRGDGVSCFHDMERIGDRNWNIHVDSHCETRVVYLVYFYLEIVCDHENCVCVRVLSENLVRNGNGNESKSYRDIDKQELRCIR